MAITYLNGQIVMGKLPGQILRFGVVGITATATHITAALVLVEWAHLEPLKANFFAFSVAVLVAFGGHYHWTFKASNPYSSSLPKFSAIALLGMGFNQTIIFSVVNLLGLDYRLGLAVVIMVVPVISFMANKRWAFQAIND